MDARILRIFIYIFSGLIAVFSLLMLINYVGSLSVSRTGPREQPEDISKMPDAESLAQQALAAAKYSGGARASMIPGPRQGLSTGAVNSDGSIMLVKEKDFNGVAEAPKDMMALLNDMGGGKKKPAPIALKDSDLDKVIKIGGTPVAKPHLKGAVMPEMGRGSGQEGVTLFSAPVEYKLFKSSETWWAFANSHKCRTTAETGHGEKPLAVSTLANPDFSSESVLVLISVSELPNGIFKIMKLEKAGKELLLSYRVDPLAMAAGGGTAEHDFYSAAVVPKVSAVKLRQLP